MVVCLCVVVVFTHKTSYEMRICDWSSNVCSSDLAALARPPELKLASASVGQALADVDAARAEKRPDWGFNVAFQRRDPQFGSMVSVGATMTLPLFPGLRQNPRIEAARADAVAAGAEKEDIRRTLEAQLETALAEHAMHHDQRMRARDTLLPLRSEEHTSEL